MKEKIKSSPKCKGFAAVFCVVILFTCGYLVGTLANININMPMKQQEVVATVPETTTVPTTTAPTTTAPPTTVPTTVPETTTTTTAPSTTEAEEECCLAGLCDTIKGVFSTIFPCLAE